jgi:hypothetical protein
MCCNNNSGMAAACNVLHQQRHAHNSRAAAGLSYQSHACLHACKALLLFPHHTPPHTQRSLYLHFLRATVVTPAHSNSKPNNYTKSLPGSSRTQVTSRRDFKELHAATRVATQQSIAVYT